MLATGFSGYGQSFAGSGSIRFMSSSLILDGSTYHFSGDTYIGYNASVYKSLLYTDGLVTYDTTTDILKFSGAHHLYAQVAEGSRQLIWDKTSTDIVSVSISDLIGAAGMTIPNGKNVLFHNMPVAVSKIYFANPPAAGSMINDSYLEVDGVLELPDTGGTIHYVFRGTSRLAIHATGNYASSFSAALNTSFTVHGSRFHSQHLILIYDENSQRLSLSGNTVFNIGSNTISGVLGNSTHPGMVFENGHLNKLVFNVSDTFRLFNQKFHAQNLVMSLDIQGSEFGLSGEVGAEIEQSILNLQLGDFRVKDDKITHFQASFPGSFNIQELTFNPGNLTFALDTSGDQRFYAFGDLSCILKADNTGKQDTIAASLGTSEAPGLEIVNGALSKLSLGVSTAFTLKSLVFQPEALTFQYDRSAARYEIFGKVKVGVKTDSIVVDLGTDEHPGFRIANGKLLDVRAGITADFTVSTVSFSPKDLTFFYSETNNNFGIFGDVSIAFQGNTIDMQMGDEASPGLLFSTTNGELENLNLTTSNTLQLFALNLNTTGLTFQYNKANDLFEMYGSVAAVLKGDSLKMEMGDETHPGLLFQNGTLKSLNFSIEEDMKLFGLTLKTGAATGCSYNAAAKKYGVYGDVILSFSTETMEVQLGTSDNPGLVIVNSEVESLDFTVNGDFNINVLTLKPQNVTFHYDKANGYYEMYGNVQFTLENETVTANLGTATAPGFTIHNGELTELNLSITSSLKIANFEVDTKDVGIYYVREANDTKYVMRGAVTFKDLWSISSSLGVEGDPTKGLEIIEDNNGKLIFDVTDFMIEAKNVNLGGVSFNDIMVRYDELKDGGFEVDAKVDVSFPAGFEVGGEIDFIVDHNKFILNKIDLFYDAGTSMGIEVGNTGIFITHVEGEVDLVPGTSDYAFKGNMAVEAGGQFSVPGTSDKVTMLRIEGSAEVDKNHLNLTNTVYVGAYNAGSGWKALYGSGSVTLDLNWNTGVYKVKGAVLYEAVVNFKSEIDYYSNGTIAALGEVDVIVPDAIPVIGGTTLASVSGAIRYNKHDLYNSYAAGWTTIDMGVKNVTVGLEYNFGSKKIFKIGQDDVDNLQTQVRHDQVKYLTYTWRVPKGVKALTINLKPIDGHDLNWLLLKLALDHTPLYSINDFNLVMPNGSSSMDIGTMLSNALKGGATQASTSHYTVTVDETSVNGIAFHFQGLSADEGEAIPTGQYSFVTSFADGTAPFTVEFQNHFLNPTTRITDIQIDHEKREIKTTSNAHGFVVKGAASVAYFQSDTPDYRGSLIASKVVSTDTTQGFDKNNIQFSYVVQPDSMAIDYDAQRRPITKIAAYRNKPVYIYSVLRDGLNTPQHSAISLVDIKVAMDVAVQPGKITYTHSGTTLSASVKLDFTLGQLLPERNDEKKFLVRVFYDHDAVGYNGFPVSGLQDVPLDEFRKGNYSFHIDDLVKLGNSTTYYFYAQVYSRDYKEGYPSDYSAAVTFNAPVTATVTYNIGQNHIAPANGIRVWLDLNQNLVYDQGVDPVHVTDARGGACGFFIPKDGTYTVGLLLDSATQAANAGATLTKATSFKWNASKTVDFMINMKTYTVNGTYKFVDKHNNPIDINHLLSVNGHTNYFFMDRDRDGRWTENIEPRAMNDASQQFSFTANTPTVFIRFVNALDQVSSKYRTDLQFSVNGKTIHPFDAQSAEIDSRLITNNTISLVITVVMKNY